LVECGSLLLYFTLHLYVPYIFGIFKYELPVLKEHLDKSIVEVCTVADAELLHDVALLHNLNEAAEGIFEFIAK
jgi:hypothetical protein